MAVFSPENHRLFKFYFIITIWYVALFFGCKKDENKAPVASAGSSLVITLPTNSASLVGSGTDADGQVVGYLWSQVSGPGSSSIENPGSPSTSVNNLLVGTYVFQFMVTDDKGAVGVDTTSVVVNPYSYPTGSIISGSVVPADGAFRVRLRTGTDTVYVDIDSLGNFNFSPEYAGAIQAYPTAGYLIPPEIPVLIYPPFGPNITLPPIYMQRNSHSDGRMVYTLDGGWQPLAYPYTYARSDSNGFLIGSITKNGQDPHWSISVTLEGVNGPGSYPVGNTSDYNFSILRYVGATVYTWGTISGGSGLVNITTMDTVSRRISGTFTVTAVPESTNASGNVIISDGAFDNLYYAKH